MEAELGRFLEISELVPIQADFLFLGSESLFAEGNAQIELRLLGGTGKMSFSGVDISVAQLQFFARRNLNFCVLLWNNRFCM